MEIQARHSSFSKNKTEYKFLNQKIIVQMLGKSYKLSTETIGSYNTLISDMIVFLFTNARSSALTIEDIKLTCLQAVGQPLSTDLIQFTNREFHEEFNDDSFKETYDIKSLQERDLFQFLLSQNGKVIESESVRAECDKLCVATGKLIIPQAASA